MGTMASEDFGCPSCERSFDSSHGMKVHHTMAHGESLVKKTVSCDTCGTDVTRFESELKGNDGVYCSPECKYDEGRIEIECSYCGETRKRPIHRARRAEVDFCSRECYINHLEEGGDAVISYIDGRFSDPDYYEKRNSARLRENKPKARERDDHECQSCGMTNEEHLDKYGCSLHVHHIEPIAEFDDPEESHTLDNLLTLCLPCHRDLEGESWNHEAAG